MYFVNPLTNRLVFVSDELNKKKKRKCQIPRVVIGVIIVPKQIHHTNMLDESRIIGTAIFKSGRDMTSRMLRMPFGFDGEGGCRNNRNEKKKTRPYRPDGMEAPSLFGKARTVRAVRSIAPERKRARESGGGGVGGGQTEGAITAPQSAYKTEKLWRNSCVCVDVADT